METGKTVTIRQALPSDANSIAILCEELGYPTTPQEAMRRIEMLLSLPSEELLVAVYDQQLAGCMHLSLLHSLIHNDHVVINALVVSQSARGFGIGAKLLLEAECWAKDHSIQSLLVRSNNIREDAHRFYLREGFHRIKTSAVFEKCL